MSRCRVSLLVIASLATLHHATLAQGQNGERPPRKLAGSPAEFPQPFSVVRAVMSLPDGRLVITDPEENKILLIDFAKGTSRQLSRVGQGPQEYRGLGGLYHGRAGRVLVFDRGQRRLLPISANGALEDVVALPIPGSSSSAGNRAPDPYAADSLGNAVGPERRGRAALTADSMPLVRYERAMTSTTLGMLAKQPEKLLEASGNVTRSQSINFTTMDAWGMAPDGAVVVVRSKPYRVEWYPLTGKAILGQPVTYATIQVTSADREAVKAGLSKVPGTMNIGMGTRGSSPPSATTPREPAEQLFADIKAPFNATFGHWPILDEQGRLWVERFQPAGKKEPVFDLFDRQGVLVDRVELPAGSRLVGFDAAWVYTVRTDSDDLEHLQRYPLKPR